MNITKIIAVSTFGILLSACNANQMQKEGSAGAVMDSTGPAHIHNVEGHGDVTHSHKGNSTESHGHSYDQIKGDL